jgi:hypothetical protein
MGLQEVTPADLTGYNGPRDALKAARRANQKILSIPTAKNIPLKPSGKSALQPRPSRPKRGAIARRHERRAWDAMDAAASARQW